MTQTRTLVLIRHAKAEDRDGPAQDHDRVLTTRGVRDAEQVGRWLKAESVRPDFVWCSTSARTRETWAAIVETSGAGPIVDHDHRIYDALPRTLLQVVQETPEEASTVALVGHAPGVPALAAGLAEGNSDLDFFDHFRTSGVVVLDIPVEWADLTAGVAQVRASYAGRDESK